jgi:hypothetical protein
MNSFAVLLLTMSAPPESTDPAVKTALQKFNSLIGEWKGTGSFEGAAGRQKNGFWTEEINWSWQFQGQDIALIAEWASSQNWSRGELRYLPKSGEYQFRLTTPGEVRKTFVGKFQQEGGGRSPCLILERTEPASEPAERLVITLLHNNRHLYRLERKADNSNSFSKIYQVGATKKGVPFAQANQGPECVVSGGVGTIMIKYQGKTYFVCCSGCKDAFFANPEQYISKAAAGQGK